MMMRSASPSFGTDGVEFTPEVIEKIKDMVAQGISRDEIASRLGVTVGYLQVTCLRLGISLRRIILPNGSGRHTADVRIAPVREQKEVPQPTGPATPLVYFAIMMRYKGGEQATDIPFPSGAIEVLALEAMSRDLTIAELVGQSLVAAINEDMIKKILR